MSENKIVREAKESFWKPTVRSAKEAVALYFEPLRGLKPKRQGQPDAGPAPRR
jgi:hypothetical protein